MKIVLYAYLFVACVVVVSCSHLPDDSRSDNWQQEETVNGFSVHWSRYVDEATKKAIRDLLNKMVFVKGGLFMMGATDEQTLFTKGYGEKDEYPVHYVRLDDFCISSEELSYEFINILHNTDFYSDVNVDYGWDDWNLVLRELRTLTGIRFDFPTEAQWEYAARGGQESKGYIYPGSNEISQVWNKYNDKTAKQSIPNELGIYHMGDQRQEWCKDKYASYENCGYVQINPICSAGIGHVLRGGSMYDFHPEKSARVSHRDYSEKGRPAYLSYTLRPVINIDKQ